MIPGRGDDPNQHDILTGTNADGTLAAGQTCGDWTLNGEGTAMLGHVDRMGPRVAGHRHVVERSASVAWLQPGEPGRHRRRRATSTASRRSRLASRARGVTCPAFYGSERAEQGPPCAAHRLRSRWDYTDRHPGAHFRAHGSGVQLRSSWPAPTPDQVRQITGLSAARWPRPASRHQRHRRDRRHRRPVQELPQGLARARRRPRAAIRAPARRWTGCASRRAPSSASPPARASRVSPASSTTPASPRTSPPCRRPTTTLQAPSRHAAQRHGRDRRRARSRR